MDFPPIARVRQRVDHPALDDAPGAVAAAIRSSRIADRVPGGGHVALTVGSRGIAGIDRIAAAAVEALKDLGFSPFIVAAMGSHGGGTSRRPARAARRARRHRGRGRLPDPIATWTPSPSAPNRLACRSTSTAMPSPPTASSCSTGSSRTPRSPAVMRAAC